LYKYSPSFSWGVAGALTAYDLPDLAACIAPRKLAYFGLLNGEKEPASESLISEQMGFTRNTYAQCSPGSLKIAPVIDENISAAIISWLSK
jgi:hypothetical protein